MIESARNWGRAFQNVTVRVAPGLRLKLAGHLKAHPELQELPIFREPRRSHLGGRTPVFRAFRVCGQGLSRDGILKGDRVLVDSTAELQPGKLVLAEVAGSPVLKRVSTTAPSAIDSSERAIGAFVGIIRKRGFGRARRTVGEGASPVTRASVLRGQLHMLEKTRAGTGNPRLQRALQNEADRVRIQLQNEAGQD